MALPKYSQLVEIITIEKIDEEILLLQKMLFDLKMKKATNQNIKYHSFVHTKRRIAQLNYKKSSLLKN